MVSQIGRLKAAPFRQVAEAVIGIIRVSFIHSSSAK